MPSYLISARNKYPYGFILRINDFDDDLFNIRFVWRDVDSIRSKEIVSDDLDL